MRVISERSFDKLRRTAWARDFVLWIGGFWSVKNPLQVLEIANSVPDLNFILIGSCRDQLLLQRFMSQKPSNVYYLGPIHDPLKTALIRKCSIGLSTSRGETFGWTPFEFLLEGKPMVAPPLAALKEIYGDMLSYANTTHEFIQRIKNLQRVGFRTRVTSRAALGLRKKYDFAKAADVITKKFSKGPLTILGRDTESDYIAGFFLVDWKLWKSMKCKGVDLLIVSDGTAYATEFELLQQTTMIPRQIVSLGNYVYNLEAATKRRKILRRKLLRLMIFLAEPLCYVVACIKLARRRSSRAVLAEGRPQVAAAIVLKLIFRLKTACLLHDDGFYKEIWDNRSPLLLKTFNLLLAQFLKHVDHLFVVSETLRTEALRFYPYRDRISVIWQEDS